MYELLKKQIFGWNDHLSQQPVGINFKNLSKIFLNAKKEKRPGGRKPILYMVRLVGIEPTAHGLGKIRDTLLYLIISCYPA